MELGSRLVLGGRFRTLRELSSSQVEDLRFETERRTYEPSFRIHYDPGPFRVAADGSWLEREIGSDGGAAPDQSRGQLGANLRWDALRSSRVTLSYTHSRFEEVGGATPDRESREHLGLLSAEQGLGRSWEFEYRLTLRESDRIERDLERRQRNHWIELTGNPTAVDGRLRANARLRSQFFHQEVETGAGASGGILLAPLSATVALDDTPEVLDPLEDDPLPVPGLIDGDLEAPTPINLGDAAEPVREFGGDYRNVQVDFGDERAIERALLYVDLQLLLPELYEWRVFTSNDPDGRVWDEVPAGLYTIAYVEPGGLRQGWEVRFSSPRSARWFKMVDVKLGETVPDLFVTELEVFRPGSDGSGVEAQASRFHRADAGFSYDLTSALRFGYQTTLRTRDFQDEVRDQEDVRHHLNSQWRHQGLLLTGRYGLHRLWTGGERTADVADYGLSARQDLGREVVTTLSWSRTVDVSDDRDRTTESVSLLAAWDPTSRLRVRQQVSRGYRRDDAFDLRATSVALRTSVAGSPFRSLALDFDRTDRWVDQAGGSGFERFNDTSLGATWSPVALVILSSYVSYQERQTDEWLVRNSIGWTPYPGGRIETRLGGYTYADTRVDANRYGAQASALWHVRRGIRVEGSVEATSLELAGERTTPLSTQLHLSWTF